MTIFRIGSTEAIATIELEPNLSLCANISAQEAQQVVFIIDIFVVYIFIFFLVFSFV